MENKVIRRIISIFGLFVLVVALLPLQQIKAAIINNSGNTMGIKDPYNYTQNNQGFYPTDGTQEYGNGNQTNENIYNPNYGQNPSPSGGATSNILGTGNQSFGNGYLDFGDNSTGKGNLKKTIEPTDNPDEYKVILDTIGDMRNQKVDIMFVLDASNSMARHYSGPYPGNDGVPANAPTRWQDLKTGLSQFVKNLEQTPADVQVGAVRYGTEGSQSGSATDPNSANPNVKGYAKAAKFNSGTFFTTNYDEFLKNPVISNEVRREPKSGTPTALGLDVGISNLYDPSAGARTDAYKIIITITDGASTMYPTDKYAKCDSNYCTPQQSVDKIKKVTDANSVTYKADKDLIGGWGLMIDPKYGYPSQAKEQKKQQLESFYRYSVPFYQNRSSYINNQLLNGKTGRQYSLWTAAPTNQGVWPDDYWNASLAAKEKEIELLGINGSAEALGSSIIYQKINEYFQLSLHPSIFNATMTDPLSDYVEYIPDSLVTSALGLKDGVLTPYDSTNPAYTTIAKTATTKYDQLTNSFVTTPLTLGKTEQYGREGYRIEYKVKIKDQFKDGTFYPANKTTVLNNQGTIGGDLHYTVPSLKGQPKESKIHKNILVNGQLIEDYTMVSADEEVNFIGTALFSSDKAITSLNVEDKLDPRFVYVDKSYRVYLADDNSDITNKGTLSTANGNLVWNVKPNEVSSLLGKKVYVSFKVKLKNPEQVDQMQGVKIPNKLAINQNGNKIESNQVTVTPPITPSSITKTIPTQDGIQHSNIVDKDGNYQYAGNIYVVNKELTTLTFTDDLDYRLTFKDFHIYIGTDASGEEITQLGTVQPASGTKPAVVKWTTNNAELLAKIKGQKLYWTMDVQYDLSSEDNSQIDNKYQLSTTDKNGANENLESNKVTVYPPTTITKNNVEPGAGGIINSQGDLIWNGDIKINNNVYYKDPNDQQEYVGQVQFKDYLDPRIKDVTFKVYTSKDKTTEITSYGQLTGQEGVTDNPQQSPNPANVLVWTVDAAHVKDVAGKTLYWELNAKYDYQKAGDNVDKVDNVAQIITTPIKTPVNPDPIPEKPSDKAESVLPPTKNGITKNVIAGTDGNSVIEGNEVTYGGQLTVSNNVYNQKENKAGTIVFNDTMDNRLSLKGNIRVTYDNNGQQVDVSTYFGQPQVVENGQTKTYTWTVNNPVHIKELAGKRLNWHMVTTYTEDPNNTSVMNNKADAIITPAPSTIDPTPTPDKPTTPNVPVYLPTKVTKQSEGLEAGDFIPSNGVYKYKGTINVTDHPELTKFVFSDQLDSRLTFKKLVIKDGDVDITNKGVVAPNKETAGGPTVTWAVTNNINDIRGKQLTWELEVQYDTTSPNMGVVNNQATTTSTIKDKEYPAQSEIVPAYPKPQVTKDNVTPESFGTIGKDGVVKYQGKLSIIDKDLTNITLSDQLDSRLTYQDGGLVVLNAQGQDITNYGQITNVNNKLSWVVTDPTKLALLKGQTLTYTLTLSYNLNSENMNQVDNTINLSQTPAPKPGEGQQPPVESTDPANPIYPPNKITKNVTGGVTDNNVINGEEITYGGTMYVNKHIYIDGANPQGKVVFVDEMDPRLTYKDSSLHIMLNGQDVTSYGKIAITTKDGKNVLTWTVEKNDQHLQALAGQKLEWSMTCTYQDNGTVGVVNNEAQLTTNPGTINGKPGKPDVTDKPIVPVYPPSKITKTLGDNLKPGDFIDPANPTYTYRGTILVEDQDLAQLVFTDKLDERLSFVDFDIKFQNNSIKDRGQLTGTTPAPGANVVWTLSDKELLKQIKGQPLTWEMTVKFDYNQPNMAQVDNTASVTTTPVDKQPNKPVITPPVTTYPEGKIVKDNMNPPGNSIIPQDGKISYNGTMNIVDKELQEVVFSDQLDPRLTLDSLTVLVDGQPVNGTLTQEKNNLGTLVKFTITDAQELAKIKGKQLTWEMHTTYDLNSEDTKPVLNTAKLEQTDKKGNKVESTDPADPLYPPVKGGLSKNVNSGVEPGTTEINGNNISYSGQMQIPNNIYQVGADAQGKIEFKDTLDERLTFNGLTIKSGQEDVTSLGQIAIQGNVVTWTVTSEAGLKKLLGQTLTWEMNTTYQGNDTTITVINKAILTTTPAHLPGQPPVNPEPTPEVQVPVYPKPNITKAQSGLEAQDIIPENGQYHYSGSMTISDHPQLNKVVFRDKLDKRLVAGEFIVRDDQGRDITSYGTINKETQADGVLFTWTVKPEKIADIRGKTLAWDMDVTYNNMSADLSPVINQVHQDYTIGDTNNTVDSNEVIAYPRPQITKNNVTPEGFGTIPADGVVVYNGTFSVMDRDLSRVEFSDQLDSRLTLTKFVVTLPDGNEIVGDELPTLNQAGTKIVWALTNPDKIAQVKGKTLNYRIETTYDLTSTDMSPVNNTATTTQTPTGGNKVEVTDPADPIYPPSKVTKEVQNGTNANNVINGNQLTYGGTMNINGNVYNPNGNPQGKIVFTDKLDKRLTKPVLHVYLGGQEITNLGTTKEEQEQDGIKVTWTVTDANNLKQLAGQQITWTMDVEYNGDGTTTPVLNVAQLTTTPAQIPGKPTPEPEPTPPVEVPVNPPTQVTKQVNSGLDGNGIIDATTGQYQYGGQIVVEDNNLTKLVFSDQLDKRLTFNNLHVSLDGVDITNEGVVSPTTTTPGGPLVTWTVTDANTLAKIKGKTLVWTMDVTYDLTSADNSVVNNKASVTTTGEKGENPPVETPEVPAIPPAKIEKNNVTPNANGIIGQDGVVNYNGTINVVDKELKSFVFKDTLDPRLTFNNLSVKLGDEELIDKGTLKPAIGTKGADITFTITDKATLAKIQGKQLTWSLDTTYDLTSGDTSEVNNTASSEQVPNKGNKIDVTDPAEPVYPPLKGGVSKQVTDGAETGTNVITGNKLTYGGQIVVPNNVYVDGAQQQGQVVFKDTLDARLSNPQLVVKLNGKDITSLGVINVEGNVVTWTVTEADNLKQINNQTLTWEMVVDYTSDGTTTTVVNKAQAITTPAQLPGQPTPNPEPTPEVVVPTYPQPTITKAQAGLDPQDFIPASGAYTYNGTMSISDHPELTKVVFKDQLDGRLTFKNLVIRTEDGTDVTNLGTITPAVDTKGALVQWTVDQAKNIDQIRGKKLTWEMSVVYDTSSTDMTPVINKANITSTIKDKESSIDSNEVIAYPRPQITKNNVTPEGFGTIPTNGVVVYNGTFSVMDRDLSRVEFSDQLDARLTLTKFVVTLPDGSEIVGDELPTLNQAGTKIVWALTNADKIAQVKGKTLNYRIETTYDLTSTDMSPVNNTATTTQTPTGGNKVEVTDPADPIYPPSKVTKEVQGGVDNNNVINNNQLTYGGTLTINNNVYIDGAQQQGQVVFVDTMDSRLSNPQFTITLNGKDITSYGVVNTSVENGKNKLTWTVTDATNLKEIAGHELVWNMIVDYKANGTADVVNNVAQGITTPAQMPGKPTPEPEPTPPVEVPVKPNNPSSVTKQVQQGTTPGFVINSNQLTYGGEIYVSTNTYKDGAITQGQVVFKDTLDARLSNPQLVVKLDGKDITSLGAIKVEGNVVTWTVTEANSIKQIAGKTLTWQMVVDYTSDGTTSTVLNAAQVITTPAQMPGEPTPEPEPTPPVEVPVYPPSQITKEVQGGVVNGDIIDQNNPTYNYGGTMAIENTPLEMLVFSDQLDQRLTYNQLTIKFNGQDITNQGTINVVPGTKGALVQWTVNNKELLSRLQGNSISWSMNVTYDTSSDNSVIFNEASIVTTPIGQKPNKPVVTPPVPVYPGPGIVKNNVMPNANGIIQSNGIVNYNGTLNVIDKPLQSIEFIDKLDYRLTLKDFKVTFNGVDITDKGKLTPAIGTKGAKVVWTLTDKELLAQIQGKQLSWELYTIYDLSSNDLSKVENKAAFNNTLLDGTKLEVEDPAEPVYPPNIPEPIVTPQIPTGVKVGLSSAIILVIASLALIVIKRKRK